MAMKKTITPQWTNEEVKMAKLAEKLRDEGKLKLLR